ncbi:hypothetical protein Tco_1386428 [Tanacetum coccineum]
MGLPSSSEPVLLGGKGKLLLSPQQVVIGDHKNTTDTMSPNTMVDPVLEIDYPHRALKNKGIVDSGCFRHMTGNKAYLAEFQDFNGGPVAFGGSKGYITGSSSWLESLRRVFDGTEALLLPTLFILWLATVSTDSAKLVPLGKVCTAIETLKKNTAKALISLSTTITLSNTMAVLESCPKHNMVAYLEKTDGNAEFHEIIDFLTRSSIHHALTVSPVVSTTFVEQFWTSAKSKIINNVRHITAKVAGKPVSISEASIRSDLLFDDANGIDSLPNQAIFDAIQLMGSDQKASEEQAKPCNHNNSKHLDAKWLLKHKIGKKEILRDRNNGCTKSLIQKGEGSLYKGNLQSYTEDVLSTDKKKVSTDKEKVSTDKPIVSTDGSKVSTDRQKDSTDEQSKDRDDLNAVYQLVMNRYQDEIPEGFDRDWNIVSWKLHGSSGVHTLMTEAGLVIHLLVEKKYPLRKKVLLRMLELKLESEEDNTMALELIRFVKHKNWVLITLLNGEELIVQDQNSSCKRLIKSVEAVALQKLYGLSMHLCYGNEALKVQSKRYLVKS